MRKMLQLSKSEHGTRFVEPSEKYYVLGREVVYHPGRGVVLIRERKDRCDT